MQINLAYGQSSIPLVLPEHNLIGVIKPETGVPLTDIPGEISRLVNLAPSLKELAKERKPRRVVIVVSDATRPIPYGEVLPPLLNQLHQAGISDQAVSLVIASGVHRPNTEQENLAYFGREILSRCRLVNHSSDQDLVLLGALKDGTELWVNRTVAEAELLITTGLIMPHNLAGFSGGPKSILPGVCGRITISANHQLMSEAGVGPGRLQENPIHRQIWEAAQKAGVDYNLNLIVNGEDRVLAVVAGSLEKSWPAGIAISRSIHFLPPVGPPADLVVACAGGDPRDKNLYQAIKPLVNAAKYVHDGGTIILVARCQEGLGDQQFSRWIGEAGCPAEIISRFKREFVLGGHKAYMLAEILAKKEVLLVSDLSVQETEALFMRYAADLSQAVNYVRQKHGPDYQALVLPSAGMVF